MENKIYNAKILQTPTITPITKKLTKAFREFYDEQILQENPENSGRNYGCNLDNWAYNREEAEEFIQFKDSVETVSKIFFGQDVTIYDDFENNIHHSYFVSIKHRIIDGYIFFKLINDRMETCGLWNKRDSKGLVRTMLIEYYLPKYKYVISDNETSTQGQEFWKKIIKYGLENNYEVGILYYQENTIYPFQNYDESNLPWNGIDLGNKRVYIKEKHE